MTENAATLVAHAQKKLQGGYYADAVALADQALLANQTDRDALYVGAVARRYQSDYKGAQNILDRLKSNHPDYGRAYQEEGYLYRTKGDFALALAAFQQAVRYNPALVASWRILVELLASAGHHKEADEAEAQRSRLEALPRELLAVTNHIHEGRILKAEKIARSFLHRNPKHVEGIRLLAEIGSRLGVHEDSDFLLETAIELEPDNIQLRIDYIQVLRKRQKFEAALEQARALLKRDPESPVFQSLFAIECMQAGEYETALSMFDKVLEVLPNDPTTLTSRGHALKTYGSTADAIASYQKAVRVDRLHGDAWYALANLKTYRFTKAEVEEMETAQASGDASLMSRIHIAFALGKAYEDTSAIEKAFSSYEVGNALKRQQTRYTSDQMIVEFEAQKNHCTAQLFARRAGVGYLAPDPIFIVGLPRAGSTLIEQILASHSQVDGTLELPNILSLAHRLRGRQHLTDRERYPRVLHELPDGELIDLGEEYIDSTRIHRKGAAYFTDKMPNNFRHLGLIHLILPNAKIIDARRDPMDCCWSGFKQLFAEGQEFTYGLEEIGQYYRSYVDLMNHWEQVLPQGRILRVQHEDLLNDLEGQVRRILKYCGLDFETACLDFHQTKRAVRTASSEQVRQPLSRAGQDQWRPFEPFLTPLKTALGDLLPTDIRSCHE